MKHRAPIALSRRGFLTTTGGLLALPLLYSGLPASVRAIEKASPTPKRLVLVHMPCGMVMKSFLPTQTGTNFPLSPTLSGLTDLQDQLLVLSNMQNDAAQNSVVVSGEGRHSKGLATLFTGANLKEFQPGPLAATSMDQIYAAAISGQTAVPSMQLGLNDSVADCDANYACIDIRAMSWLNATTPLVDQCDPQKVFDQYIAGSTSSAALAQLQYQRSRRQSVLDGVLSQANSLNAKLTATDQQRLDQYLTSVRAVEQQLTATATSSCPTATRPTVSGSGALADRATTMMDLMALSFQCDLTRVLTYNFGAGHCDTYFNFLPGITDVHHSLSHNNGDAGMLAQLATIEKWQMDTMGRFWRALKAIPEGESTVLDNSVTLVTSELADGNLHNYTDLAVLVVGKGGGAVVPGRHVRAGTASSYGNLTSLQLSLLQAVGANVSEFGDFKQSTAMSLTA